ncbi:hypothetical protein OG21DRAFT_1510970 [Imleria badia]|nr:hypothetical protein OG21DRAFT_1510970 [Imleria badia]
MDVSPRAAKPCAHPAKYSLRRRLGREHLVYLARVDQEGNARLFEFLSRRARDERSQRTDALMGTTDLEVLGNLGQRGVRDGSDFDDLVKCEVKGVTSWVQASLSTRARPALRRLVLTTEVVTCGSKLRHALFLEGGDDFVEGWSSGVWSCLVSQALKSNLPDYGGLNHSRGRSNERYQIGIGI